MDFGIKFINLSGVKCIGIGKSHDVCSHQYVSAGTPECELDFHFYGLKSIPFSCIGGIL